MSKFKTGKYFKNKYTGEIAKVIGEIPDKNQVIISYLGVDTHFETAYIPLSGLGSVQLKPLEPANDADIKLYDAARKKKLEEQ